MSELNEAAARAEIRACVDLCGPCDMGNKSCHAVEKAFLQGLEQERARAKGLVEALKAQLDACGLCGCGACRKAEKAIAAYEGSQEKGV